MRDAGYKFECKGNPLVGLGLHIVTSSGYSMGITLLTTTGVLLRT